MGADLSRIRSNPLLDFAGVELKQGGVLLDADVNELVAVIDRRLRAAASDILGRSTVSQTTPDAFHITVQAGTGTLQIGKGRLYVDGLLAENHSGPPLDPADPIVTTLFDPLLAEPTSVDPVTYETQPYLPSLPVTTGGTTLPLLPSTGRHLVYLDVWQRELTHLERPDLVEIAVGVETSSRLQIVWQVRVLADDAGTASCTSPDGDVAGWARLIAPSSGRLTTGTFDVPPTTDPCELPPTGGYRGLENQTYRVEIQDPGEPGGVGATFKWSRENASVGSRVASIISSTELELQTLGRDDVLRFNTGDWVEIIDDVRELAQRCGELRQITVNEAARRITFIGPLPADLLPGFPGDGDLRVRRWDQKGKVLQAAADGTTPVFQDLDTVGNGAINVPASGTTLLLENGITVRFSHAGTKGFRAGDYWVFAARTADASIELLEDAPPRGVHHHYARLGIWDVAKKTVTDCRTPWPPRGEGHDCTCTICVTQESHASGAMTIQGAVDRIAETGGTVCLGIGDYLLREPVRLIAARSVRIKGQGSATTIVTPGGAFSISTGIALAIEDLAIVSLGGAAAISVRTVVGLTLQRLVITIPSRRDATGPAIALGGSVIGATIRDNAITAPVAVQAADPANGDTPALEAPARMLATTALRIEDNALLCDLKAIALEGPVVHSLTTRVAGNEILGCTQGAITLRGLCAAGASVRVERNGINVDGPGIIAGVDGLWIEGNKLVGSSQAENRRLSSSGITLRTGFDPNGANECQILGNQISGFESAGILIASPTRELIVKLNIIQDCGNGILSADDARATSVSIENNHISDIGSAAEGVAGEVVGVGVLRADAAAVVGNSIRRIGLLAERAGLRAGVVAGSVRRLRVSGNDIMDIGPPGSFEVGRGVGVLLRAPYAEAEISHNQIDRESEPLFRGAGNFIALWIDEPIGERVVSRIGAFATLRVDARTSLVLGTRRPFLIRAAAAGPAGAAPNAVRGANASVIGNVIGSRGPLPASLVEASGDCLFSDNRCELRGESKAPAVDLAASAMIVNANRVRGGGEASVLIRGAGKNVTVLGNITTGPISGMSPQPWGALNVVG